MSEYGKNFVSDEEKFEDVNDNKYTSDELEEMIKNGKDAHARFFNESRTNVLIYGSDHYSKMSDNLKRSIEKKFRSSLDEAERKKLTLNFIQSIMDKKINKIVGLAPGCIVTPYKSDDVHQCKEAKISDSVLKAIKKANNWNEISPLFVSDHQIIGEVWSYTYFDFDKGDIIGYEKKDLSGLPDEERFEMDEMGQFVFDESDQPVEREEDDPEKPIFSGEVCIESIDGFNVCFEEGVRNFHESAWGSFDKPVHKNTLKYMIQEDEEFSVEKKEKLINLLKSSDSNEFLLFDRNNGSISDNKDMINVRYMFFRPSPKFPRGKIFVKLKEEIIWSLDLQKDINEKPIFPLNMKRCKRTPGGARGYSPIRAGRSSQNEINRCVSKIAEHQVTLGDDKIVTAYSEGLAEGEKLLGIRHIKAGKGFETFKHIPGRTGEQYLPFLLFNVKHLHLVMEEVYEGEDKGGESDIKATLYKSIRQKTRYVLDAKNIEDFFIEISQTALELAKSYYPDEKVVQEAGACEAVNIQEFKALGPMDYNIALEPASDDVDSLFGKHLVLSETLQYASKQLGPENIGHILKESPWVDGDKLFGQLVVDEKESENIVLALDRGEFPEISEYDNNKEIIKQLIRRRKKGDWKMVQEKDPKIKERYQMQYEYRQEIINKQMEQEKAINAGQIPMTGPLVSIDYYVNEPKANGKGLKSVKEKLPVDAIKWTAERLKAQNMTIESIENMESDQATIDAGMGMGKPANNNGGV